jgi:two-component system, cell cycle response regulator DivK
VTDAHRRGGRRPVVLIVDDDPDTRELYATTLPSADLEAVGAADAVEAFRLARERRPNIIVTDLSLPKTDGWELIQSLRRDRLTSDIPIVVLTGYIAPEMQQRAKREGCAAFLVKPCLPEQLASELRRALTRSAVYRRAAGFS